MYDATALKEAMASEGITTTLTTTSETPWGLIEKKTWTKSGTGRSRTTWKHEGERVPAAFIDCIRLLADSKGFPLDID